MGLVNYFLLLFCWTRKEEQWRGRKRKMLKYIPEDSLKEVETTKKSL